jgi:hypothetical protein
MKTAFTNYLPPDQKFRQCNICKDKLLLGATCAMCANQICANKCSKILTITDVIDKQWLQNFVGKNLCASCFPKINTASENHIKTIFATIFDSDDENSTEEYDNTKLIEEQLVNEKSLQDQEKTLDKFIGGILNLMLDEIQLADISKYDSINKIKHSYEEILKNPIMI